MYKKLLVPTDGTELAMRGLDQALALARVLGAEVVILTVTAGMTASNMHQLGYATRKRFQEQRAVVEETVRKILDTAAEHAQAAGVAHEQVLVENAYTDDAIVAVAEEHGVDLIVMATHARSGLNRLVVGSETAAVIVRSGKIPVLVVK